MGIFDPQPLPSSPTSQGTTTGAINPWAQPYVTNYLNQANAVVANQGFTPLQQQAYGGAGSLSGGATTQQGLAAANQGITGALGAGQNYQNMATNPNSMQAYMSPYIQNALDPTLREITRQYGITGMQEQSAATNAGAFGGSREALMAAENQRNKNLAMNQAIGTGYQNAFQNAQQAQQYQNTLGLQGNQAAIQGANQMATQGQGILGLQNQFGTQQQQYPYQQVGFLQSMLNGLPVSSQTTQGWQAGPNKASQIAGLGTAGAGILGSLLGGGAKGSQAASLLDYLFGTGGSKTGGGTTGGTGGTGTSAVGAATNYGIGSIKNWLNGNPYSGQTTGMGDQGASSPTLPDGSPNPNYDAYADPNATQDAINAQNAANQTGGQAFDSSGNPIDNSVSQYDPNWNVDSGYVPDNSVIDSSTYNPSDFGGGDFSYDTSSLYDPGSFNFDYSSVADLGGDASSLFDFGSLFGAKGGHIKDGGIKRYANGGLVALAIKNALKG